MKRNPLKKTVRTALYASLLLLAGCGGGGGGDSESSVSATTELTATSVEARGLAVVSGTVDSQEDTTVATRSFSPFASTRETPVGGSVCANAVVTVDADENGLFDEKDPSFSAMTENGVFSLRIPLADPAREYEARLVVSAEGYAPYSKILRLKAGKSVAVNAEAAKIPVIRETVDLSALSASARMTSFVRVGLRSEGGAVTGFSRLLSLSDLQAEADQNLSLEAGTEAEYTFPVASVPDSVTSLEITMRAFDSTDPEQLALFPGEFVGTGLERPALVTGSEVGLVSAAFDLFDVRDQEGNPVTLKEPVEDKLSASADMSGCTMIWRRSLTPAQADLIAGWGDYDPSTPEFEVPIWSNDNSEGAWKFVGLGNAYDLGGSSPYFEVCVPDEWGAGYLNCDSPVSFQEPRRVCVYTSDQNGEPIGGLTVYARKGTSYDYTSVDGLGEGMLSLPDSTLEGWRFSYAGPITRWSSVEINATPVASTREGCDYDLNVTGIVNPFSAKILVKAYDTEGAPAAGAAIYLQSLEYGPGYWSEQRTADENGEAVFDARPEVRYLLTYNAARGTVTVNGSVDGNETADTGRIATVELRDVNYAPGGSIVFERGSYKTTASTARFTVYANDPNGDTLSLVEFRLNGTRVLKVGSDIRVVNLYSYTNGYLAAYMELNLTALEGISPLAAEEGTYSLEATITDQKSEGTAKGYFDVYENRPPVVTGVVARDENGTIRYLESTNLPGEGDYTLFVYGYDPDGDAYTLGVLLDGDELVCEGVAPAACRGVSLSEGDHTLAVTATDADGAVAGREIRFHTGNLPPVILNAGTSKDLVDINRGDTFRLFAFVRDDDGAVAKVEAVDQNGTRYTLQNRGGMYETADIAPVSPGTYTFHVTATDDKGAVCAPYSVVLTVIAANQPPVFTKEPQPQRVEAGGTLAFECEAYDPEGTLVSYEWILDGTTVGSGEEYSVRFDAAGSHTLACVATDGDGESAESAATITVFDPNLTGTLTVHTLFSNVLVGVHDPADGMALIESQRTNADGTASFSVTGDRVTFSVTLDPFLRLDGDGAFKLLAERLVFDAYNNCTYGDTNMSECEGADWCALMAGDTLPAWVVDAAMADENVTGATVDLDGDGTVTKEEFLNAVVLKFDQDGDGEVTLQEVEGYDRVETHLFENVPTGEYTVPFGFFEEIAYEGEFQAYAAEAESPLYCTEEPGVTFDLNVTGIDRPLGDLSYASVYPGFGAETRTDEANGTLTFVGVRLPAPDDEGGFDFVVSFDWNDGNTTMLLVTDRSKEELADGYSVSYADFKSLTPATFVTYGAYDSLDLHTLYKGLYLGVQRAVADEYDEATDTYTRTKAFLNDERLLYTLYGYRWYPETGTSTVHQNYYSDGRLHALYDAREYPFLDLNVSFTADADVVTFRGDDLSLIDAEWFEYEAWLEGRGSFSISLYAALPAAEKNLGDINLSRLYPTDVAAFVTAIDDNDSTSRSLDAGAEEYRDATADEIVSTAFAPENTTMESVWKLFVELPMRQVNRTYDFYEEGNIVPNAAESRPERRYAPLAIPFDPTILLK